MKKQNKNKIPSSSETFCDDCNTLTEIKFVKYPMKRYGKVFSLECYAKVCPNCDAKIFDGKTITDFENKIIQQIKDAQKIAA